jgi:hypothetical protein
MSDQWPGVSARGVLDGDAEALGGLCDGRGPSVVGYCARICGPERAVEAAAAAFAAFRAGAVRARDPLSIDPEELLLGRTRAAAAQRAPKPAASLVFAEIPCSQIPVLLAERASGSISPADEDRLRQHLARCAACQAVEGIQEEAERTYFHPTLDAVDPVSRLEIIDALRRAVPPAPDGRTWVSFNGDRPDTPAPEIQQAVVGPGEPRIPKPLPRTAAVSGPNLTSTPVGQPQATGPAAPPPQASGNPGGPVPVEVIRRSTLAGGVVLPQPTTGSGSPAGPPSAHHEPTAPGPTAHDTGYGHTEHETARGGSASGPMAHGESASGRPTGEWDSPTGAMSAVDIGAALGYHQTGVDPASQTGWADAGGAGADPAGPDDGHSGRRRRMAVPFSPAGGGRVTVPRVLGPVAVLVVGLLVALFVAGVFTSGSHGPPAGSVSGGQTNPSATPTGTSASGSSAIGGGSTGGGSAAGDGSTAASAGVTTAASRAAAKKRAAALARKLRAAGGTGAAKTSPSSPATPSSTQAATGTRVTSPSSGSRTTSPTSGGTPGSRPTSPTGGAPAANVTKPSSGTGTVTVHELGAGAGSARPVTGVPATGATGYQPG